MDKPAQPHDTNERMAIPETIGDISIASTYLFQSLLKASYYHLCLDSGWQEPLVTLQQLLLLLGCFINVIGLQVHTLKYEKGLDKDLWSLTPFLAHPQKYVPCRSLLCCYTTFQGIGAAIRSITSCSVIHTGPKLPRLSDKACATGAHWAPLRSISRVWGKAIVPANLCGHHM